MKSCSAYGCSNHWFPGCRYSFHRFPLNKPDLLSKWVQAIRRKNFVPNKSSNLCSDHFTDDSFKRKDFKRILKRDAIPCIFDYRQRPILKRLFAKELIPVTDEELQSASNVEPFHVPNEEPIQVPNMEEAKFLLIDPLEGNITVKQEYNSIKPTCKDVAVQSDTLSLQVYNKLRRKIKGLQQSLRRKDATIRKMRDILNIIKEKSEKQKPVCLD